MSANPHANGGLLLRDLRLPDFRDYAVYVADARRTAWPKSTRVMGGLLRDVMKLNMEARNFRLFSPDESNSNQLARRSGGDQSRLGRGLLFPMRKTDLAPDGG